MHGRSYYIEIVIANRIVLLSAESECTDLLCVLREAIQIIKLLKEMKSHGFALVLDAPTIQCKVFEENNRALEMATTHNFCHCVKYINVKLYHFYVYVTRGGIWVLLISTKFQLADCLTKPLTEDIFILLCKKVLG